MWEKVKRWLEEKATLSLLTVYDLRKTLIVKWLKSKAFNYAVKKIFSKLAGIKLWLASKGFTYLWNKIAPNTVMLLLRRARSKLREKYLRVVAKNTLEAENEKQYRNSLDDLFK